MAFTMEFASKQDHKSSASRAQTPGHADLLPGRSFHVPLHVVNGHATEVSSFN